MQLIWHGTASVEIVCASGRILFDPFVPLKGSDVDVTIEEFDGFPDILVTHGHFDHIVTIPEIVSRNPSATVYCTHTPYQTLEMKGVPARSLRRITYGEVIRLGGFTITVFHSRHAVLPELTPSFVASFLESPHRGNLPFVMRENRLCRENGETVFYQIEAEGKRVSLMGSLNLREEVTYPTDADLLVLPYNGWENNYVPAVGVIERLKPKRVVLDHYDDTFPPLTRPIDLSPILKVYDGVVTPMELRKTVEV